MSNDNENTSAASALTAPAGYEYRRVSVQMSTEVLLLCKEDDDTGEAIFEGWPNYPSGFDGSIQAWETETGFCPTEKELHEYKMRDNYAEWIDED